MSGMSLHEALYTTRAMRRIKDDPIPEEVQKRILDAAIRAPSGGNAQNWRFLLVDDPAVRGQLAPIYRECIDALWTTIYKDQVDQFRGCWAQGHFEARKRALYKPKGLGNADFAS